MASETRKKLKKLFGIAPNTIETGWQLMQTAKAMAELYEANREICSKYVHATSRGHEAIQIACGLQLLPQDYVFPYYRDDAMLLAIGMKPYELMLQLLAKRDDPFSGGRTYYSHPSLRDVDKPKIPHNSSATGMQAIPSTGVAMGLKYQEKFGLLPENEDFPIVICSIGDAAMTEGEISEALQMAVLKSLPIIYLVQDNEWDISATADEVRVNDAAYYARGFKGLETRSIDGTDFAKCWNTLEEIIAIVRTERRPFLIHAKVPLLNHHTSGVRKETYRHDLEKQALRDPLPKLREFMLESGWFEADLDLQMIEAQQKVESDFQRALVAPDPNPADLFKNDFAPSPIIEELGERNPINAPVTLMVDCALFAVQEILEDHPEALLYGQDVGERLGGVFREAATLGKRFGNERVFNTPIMEAFIIGSTVGMAAAGCKPIVEVQFADYIWPGLNQLFTELSRSYYLSNGKWPAQAVIRVPIGAYGSGGPYHSSSIESVLSNIRGIKVVYPSNGADLKGLIKSAFADPNPVVILEHKGLYWSKLPGTTGAKVPLPDRQYAIPIGKARMHQKAHTDKIKKGDAAVVITYGMGVYWAEMASKEISDRVSILDLRSISPWDKEAVYEAVSEHGRCLILTEEPSGCSFAPSIAGAIQENCFKYLDAPIKIIASEDLPAIPLNCVLEETMLPNASKVALAVTELLNW